MKYDFEECIRRVKAEVQAVYKNNKLKVDILEMFKPIDKQKPITEVPAIFHPIEPEKPKAEKPSNPPAVGTQPPAATTIIATRPIPPNVKEINWSESECYKWFQEKKIDENIIKNLSPCDGRILYELFLIKTETPEFFYKSIGLLNHSYKSSTLRDVALFSYELKKIFLH